MARVWIGKETLSGALADERVYISGDPELRRSMPKWFKLAALTEVGNAYPPLFEMNPDQREHTSSKDGRNTSI